MTSFIGTILITGWMGGAIAVHVRVKDNFLMQMLLPILVWIGFALQHEQGLRLLLNP